MNYENNLKVHIPWNVFDRVIFTDHKIPKGNYAHIDLDVISLVNDNHILNRFAFTYDEQEITKFEYHEDYLIAYIKCFHKYEVNENLLTSINASDDFTTLLEDWQRSQG